MLSHDREVESVSAKGTDTHQLSETRLLSDDAWRETGSSRGCPAK